MRGDSRTRCFTSPAARQPLPRPILALFGFFIALAAPLPRSAHADELRLLTMREGTAWYAFGATLYKLLKDDFPEHTHLVVLPRGGGVVNPLVVASGRADLAIANVATARWAFHGETEAYADKPCTNLRALAGGLNPVWLMILAREDFLEKSGSTSLETILTGDTPVRIVMKPRGSSVPLLAGRILEILGTSRQSIVRRGGSILQVPAAQIPGMLRAGAADLYLEAGPLGHPTVTEATLTTRLRFLPLSPALLKALNEDGLPESPLPPFFKGQPGPVPSVDLGTVLIARDDLPAEIAYLITKTLCENREAMARAHKAWSRFDPSRAALPSLTGVPLHPGAARFYREQGWLTHEDPAASPQQEPASAGQ